MKDVGISFVAELNSLPGTLPEVTVAQTPDTPAEEPSPDDEAPTSQTPADGSKVEIIDPMKQPLWEVDDRILNPFAELPKVMTWGEMGSRPAIERQGIITISAKPKQGKSLSVYALLTSIISGSPIDTFTPDKERPRLAIVFDTEMNRPTLQYRAKGVYKALGAQQNRFMIVPLLAVPKSERKAVIEDITARYNPDIVVMDVVTKLVKDFNSSDENSAFGDWLEKYAEKRTVMVVIHQNKAADNSSMKGHLGSILGEAAVENYTSVLKDGVFTLSPVNARNSCAEGAPGVSFTLKDDGTFTGAAQTIEMQKNQKAEVWRNILRPYFEKNNMMIHKEICAIICKEHDCKPDAAEKAFKNIVESGAIVKVGNKKRDPYMLT